MSNAKLQVVPAPVVHEIVRAFFDALATGRLDLARGMTAAGFTWLDRLVGDREWDLLARWAEASSTQVATSYSLPGELFELLSPDARSLLFGGAVSTGSEILLADVRRDDVSVQIGVVVDHFGRLLRLFDPMPLKRAFRAFAG